MLKTASACRTITPSKTRGGGAGPIVQYWMSDKFNVEAGGGVGFWSGDTDEDNQGFGLILGAGYSVSNRGKHNVQIGVQYAPAFTGSRHGA